MAQRVARQNSIDDRNYTFWTALTISVVIGIMGAAILYFLGEWLFAAVFRIPADLRPEMVTAVPWLAAIVPLTAVISVLAGALEARQAFVALNLSQMTGVIGLQVLPLAVAMFGHTSMPMLLAAALTGRLIGVVVMAATTAHTLPFHGTPHIRQNEIGPLLRFGGWMSVSGLVTPFLSIIDRFFVGGMIGAAAVTAYTIPYNLTQRFAYLPLALSTTLFPRFSNGDKESTKQLLNDGIIALVAIQTPFIVLAIILSYPLFRLWVGNGLATISAPVAIILLIGVWINGPAYLPHNWLPAQGRPDVMAKFYMAELLPFLAMLWWMIDMWGIIGAAVAWSIRSTADAAFCFMATGTMFVYSYAISISLVSIILSIVFVMTINHYTIWTMVMGAFIFFLAAAISIFLLPRHLIQRAAILIRQSRNAFLGGGK